jgi:hypothetical protein
VAENTDEMAVTTVGSYLARGVQEKRSVSKTK